LLLETYTTKKGAELELPGFLDVVTEVTDDPQYSMYYLSAQEKNTPTTSETTPIA
jgi:hypothetical protein